MSLYKTDVEWHDLRNDPDDLPGEGEPILVTVETFLGRTVWLDANYKEDTVGEPCFYVQVKGTYGIIEDQAIWYPVVAWAYPPAPFNDY